MKIKTLALTIFVTLISCNLFAQYGGGMYGRGYGGGYGGYGNYGGVMPGSYVGGAQAPAKRPEMNFIGAVGYFNIDAEKALEKMKIDVDEDADKAKLIVDVLKSFTKSRQELIESNRTDIDNLEFAPDNLEANKEDMNKMREIMKGVNASAKVIKPLMVEKHKALGEEMAKVLTPKELKRWAKFYKAECKDNLFDPSKKFPDVHKERDQKENGDRRPENRQEGEGRPSGARGKGRGGRN